MERQKQEALRLRTLGKVKEENTLSPYRYVTSTERYTIFGSLVKASSLSRSIHSQGVTLLCPIDDAFEADSNWKTLLREENRQALDNWIGRHVIPIVMRYEDFKTKKNIWTSMEIPSRWKHEVASKPAAHACAAAM